MLPLMILLLQYQNYEAKWTMSKRADRLTTMFAGYAMASMAAGGVMATLAAFANLLKRPISVDPLDASVWQILIYIGALLVSVGFMSVFLSVFVALFALLQSALLIGLAEFLRIRSAFYYAIAGMIAAFTSPISPLYFPGYVVTGHRQDIDLWSFLLFGGSGLVGGLVYWLFAGHAAEGFEISWRHCKSKICATLQ